jgi:hypothetical protein
MIGLILSLFLVQNLCAKDIWISMIYSNAIQDHLPLEVVSAQHWVANPKARFVKLHVYLDQPQVLSRIEISSCGAPFSGLSVFANFDERFMHMDSTAPVFSGGVKNNTEGATSVLDFKKDMLEVRSLTFNFESNVDVQVCGLKLFDAAGKSLTLQVPEVLPGKATASSTLDPVQAYDPMNLFDSRFEYGWASKGHPKGLALDFDFGSVRKVDKLRIWSGYQRSLTHCQENARPKKLKILTDDGGDFELACADKLGSQILTLPREVSTQHMKIVVLAYYDGKTYPDLVVSEIRFGDKDAWFLLDPLPKFKADIAANRAQFETAGLRSVLDDSFVQNEVGQTVEMGDQDIKGRDKDLTLRLRSDGSFYIQAKGESGAFFALGNYEVKKAAVGKALRLRLFGLLHWTEVYGDCNGCGRDCNQDDDSGGQRIFSATFDLSLKDDVLSTQLQNASYGIRVFNGAALKRED